MIIAVASQKGGTGKTTSSISLAAGVARKGKTTLLIDIDSQANSSKVLLPHYSKIAAQDTLYTTILERHPLPIHATSVPHLEIVPSHILLSNTDIELTVAKDHREARLKNELDKVKQRYDFVFIDCPPALSWLTINAFTAADKVLVVVSPGYFELDSDLARVEWTPRKGRIPPRGARSWQAKERIHENSSYKLLRWRTAAAEAPAKSSENWGSRRACWRSGNSA